MDQPDVKDKTEALEPEILDLMEEIRILTEDKAKLEKALMKLLVQRAVRLMSQDLENLPPIDLHSPIAA